MTPIDKGTLTAAKDLLEQHKLSGTANAKRRKNLDLLWDTLEEMRKAGVAKFSLAEIGKRLEAKGGPVTQSLRNKNGSVFQEVIGLYTSGLQKNLKNAEDLDGVERALATITNASAKQILRAAVNQAKDISKERDRLKAALADLSAQPPITQGPSAKHSPAMEEWAIESIHANLNASRLLERGLSISPNGVVENGQGVPILGQDFFAAVNHILHLSGKPPLDIRQP